ncbi:MAG: hypothetical protein OXQ92_04665 [Boseongicola sp.]|nr:hypothetical protein [Boseongicola sp.]MDD9976368.1 hypothetical protein [Boseongicola sp.]
MRGAATYTMIAASILAMPAFAGMQTAVDLCLDTSLDIPARAEAFEAHGWMTENSVKSAESLFRDAVIISTVSATDQTSWPNAEKRAEALAVPFGKRLSARKVHVLRTDSSAIVLQRNGQGLQTCLYVGNEAGLSIIADVLDGSVLRTIGEVTRIRGDGPKSSISSHHISPEAAAEFAKPLNYTTAFSIVLDRQPGDLP